MNRRSAVLTMLVIGAAFVVSWVLFVAVPRWYSARQQTSALVPGTTSAAGPRRTIKATLFYATADSQHLAGIARDVELADTPLEQAQRILDAQLRDPAPKDLVSTIPSRTSLRSVYVTERGEAYVDLSPEVSAAHPGGSLNEILTVYTIVHALTANLPAIKAVQILVDGREVDTLAGHVDLRRPLLPLRELMEKDES
ncbi:MAG: GerMN domain-containing protein [Acidobacteria bacterium]|nr:GerMN domain-containing protein [Acidobacteriota bacterium]